MGRRIKFRVKDTEGDYLLDTKDDRSNASKVSKTGEGFTKLVNSRGIVSQQAKQMKLFEFTGDGQVRLNKDKIKQEAAALKQQTLGARFYPEEYNRREISDTAKKLNISKRKSRNLIAREYQAKARAILAASKAGNVELDRSTKAILNKYNAGNYEGAIYGNVSPDTGQRQYAKGRYFAELGFSAAEKKREKGRSGGGGTEANRWAKRQDFLQNVQVVRQEKPESRAEKLAKTRGERTEQAPRKSRFTFELDESSTPKQETNNNPFADLITEDKKKDDNFIPF